MIVGAPNNNITNTNPVSCSMRGALQETTHNTRNTCACNNIQTVQHTNKMRNNNHYKTTTMWPINLRPYYRDQKHICIIRDQKHICIQKHICMQSTSVFWHGSKDLQVLVHSEDYWQRCTCATFHQRLQHPPSAITILS